MAIDPLMYEKMSGRKGDPYTRMGEVLAKDAKAQQARDAMPKGFVGGIKNIRWPGMWANVWLWFRDRTRYKGD